MTETDRDMVLTLPTKWAYYLSDQPESGMTYQFITIVLRDGRCFERIPHVAGYVDLTGLPGHWKVPFGAEEISEVLVTHDRSGPPRLME